MKTRFLLILILLHTSAVYAKEAFVDPDQNQPINIQADQLLFDKKQGRSHYQGHVKMTQGSLEITGEDILLIHPQQQLQEAIAKGHPATFKKYLTQQKRWIKGHARQIHYLTQPDQHLILTGNAWVQQGEHNLITGPELIYHLKNQTLEANPTPDQTQQVHITLKPPKAPPSQSTSQKTPPAQTDTKKLKKPSPLSSPEAAQ